MKYKSHSRYAQIVPRCEKIKREKGRLLFYEAFHTRAGGKKKERKKRKKEKNGDELVPLGKTRLRARSRSDISIFATRKRN